MSTLSDVEKLLSTTDTIAIGATWVSNRVLINAYTSMTVSIFADQDTRLYVEFSNDGLNYDISTQTNFTTSIIGNYSGVVNGKFCRLRLENLGAGVCTPRLYTYVNVRNTALTALISKVGNFNPEVDIGNLPTEYPNSITRLRYQFNTLGGTSTATNAGTPLPFQYYDVTPTNIFGAAGANVTGANFMLNLENNNTKALDQVAGSTYPLNFNNFAVTFIGRYIYTTDSTLGANALIGCYSNFGDRFAFGFSGTLDYDNFGIYIATPGGVSFVPRLNWNIDRADGTLRLPVIDPANLNTYRIILNPAFADFYIMSSNTFYPCHRFYYNNTTPSNVMMREASLGFYTQTFIDAASTVTTGDLTTSCAVWSLAELGGGEPIIPLVRGVGYINEATGFATETPIYSIFNSDVYNAANIYRTVKLKNITVTEDSGGTPAEIKIYLNTTLNTPSFGAVSTHTNVLVDTSSTTVSGGILLHAFKLSPGNVLSLNFEVPIKTLDTITFTGLDTGSSTISIGVTIE